MRFFTPEWMNGELSDEESEQVVVDYRSHLRSLRLDTRVRHLANGVNLHDGRLLDIRMDSNVGSLSIRIRCGDNQHGYQDQFIEYQKVSVDRQSLETLQNAKGPPFDEIVYDEVDRFENGYEHRMLFASQLEASVRFTDVVQNSILVEHRDSP